MVRDSARSQQGLAPSERVGAVDALSVLSGSGPHDMQPSSGLRVDSPTQLLKSPPAQTPQVRSLHTSTLLNKVLRVVEGPLGGGDCFLHRGFPGLVGCWGIRPISRCQ